MSRTPSTSQAVRQCGGCYLSRSPRPFFHSLFPTQNVVPYRDTNYHYGNSRFRHLVSHYKDQYQAASREERTSIVIDIIDKWRSQKPPGRFVTRTDPADREGSTWHDVGDEVCRKPIICVPRNLMLLYCVLLYA